MSIASIQRIASELVLSQGNDDEALTLGQTVANCVPWMRSRVTDEDSDNYENYTARASFTGNFLRFESLGSGTANRAMAGETQVVEFDGVNTKVQSGSFNHSGAAGSTTVTIPEAVVTGNTFIIASWYVNGGTSPWINHSSLRWELTNSTTITFWKEFSTSIIVSWWAVESMDGSFTTQPVSISVTGLSGTDTISAVDTGKSFIVGGHTTTHAADDLSSGTLGVRLTNGTTVTADREASLQGCTFSGQVVTFGASTNGRVLRGMEAMTGATASETISAVDLDRTIVQLAGSSGSFPGGRFTGAASASAPYGYATVKLTNATTIDFQRFGATETGDLYWEAIEWPESVAQTAMTVFA